MNICSITTTQQRDLTVTLCVCVCHVQTAEVLHGDRKQNKTKCTCSITQRRFLESFLPWKRSEYYVFVCVCMCVLARVCVHVALLIQHATCMRHVVTSFVAPHTPPYFSALSHKRHDFRKQVIEQKILF